MQERKRAVHIINLALNLIRQGRRQEGSELLDRAAGSGPPADTAACIDAGGGYLLLEQPDRAVEMLIEAIRRTPDDWLAQMRLGIAQALLGRYHNSLQAFSKADRLNRGEPKIQANLSRVLVRLNRPAEALDYLENLENPDTKIATMAQDIRVEALISLNRLEEAEAIVREIVETGSEHIRTLKLSALIAAGRDRHQDAVFYLYKALTLEPTNVQLRKKLAELASIQGHFAEAVHNLEQAANQEPENLIICIELAKAYLHCNRIGLAEKAAFRAVELAADESEQAQAHAMSVMAEVEAEQGKTEEAIARYRQALGLQDRCLPALLGLGHQQIQTGRIEEAVACFEKVAEHAPLAGRAALIGSRKFPEDPAQLDEIEKAALRPSLVGSVSPSLMFSLARAWEHRKEYQRAFEFARQANEATRKFIPYDPGENRTKTNRIIRQFSQDFFASRRGFGNQSPLPIFVLGMPRSGTTLVEQILASHPRIFGAGELGHIPAWCHSLTMWEVLHGSNRSYPECIEQLSEVEALRMADYCLAHLRTLGQGRDFVIDKLPHNFCNIGLIHLLFSEATIIHCVRDPRDVALSNFFTDFKAKFAGMGFAYDLEDLGHHIADYQSLMRHWHRVLPGRILDVRYESLVEEPEAVTRKILAHMGLEWDERVLSHRELDRPVKTASAWQVRQPIYKTSKEKWRRYEKELAPLERALKEGRACFEEEMDLPPELPFGIEMKEEGNPADA